MARSAARISQPAVLTQMAGAERVLVVIVCYRATALTVDCLRTLVPQARRLTGTGIAICENGSGAGESARLKAAIEENHWSDLVALKAIHPNRGFSGGNNAILADVLTWERMPEFILLLNTDTLIRPGALAAMVEAIASRKEVGILGPRLEWPNGDPQASSFRFMAPVSELLRGARTGPISRSLSRHDPVRPVSHGSEVPDWLSFACVVMRREVLQEVGLLDDNYYLYFDDVDYCRRARQRGWRMLYWPHARVVHLVGRSNPMEDAKRLRKRKPQYFYASRARYYAKFYGLAGLWMANFMWILGRGVAALREVFGEKVVHSCKLEWWDIWKNFGHPLRPPDANDAQS